MATDQKSTMGRFLLLLGVDGSGKTTILKQLEGWNYVAIEPSLTDEATNFKKNYYDQPLSRKLVDKRESMYLKLNKQGDAQILGLLQTGKNVASSGHELVTKITHEVMRSVIDGTYRPSFPLERWLEDTVVRPNEVV